MAYTKTITDANTYFGTGNHVKTYDWTSYSSTERGAAFAQAKRELEVFLGRDLYDPSSEDRFRDDYAHFEQSLFILEKTVRKRESETGAELIDTERNVQRDQYRGVTISPMAQRYLAFSRVRIVRG